MSGVAEKTVGYASTAEYQQTEVGLIPTDWEVRRFDEVARIERGKFTARPRNDPKYYGGNIPFIQTGDVANSRGWIRTYSQTLNEEGLKVSKKFPAETLFFTIAANIGDVAFSTFETACPDSLVAITPHIGVQKFWLVHELRRRKQLFVNLASHNAQSNINLAKLNPVLLPLPPTAEQEAIATALSDADALIESLEQLLAKKRLIKQGAMQELLSGDWPSKAFGDLFKFSGGYSASRNDLGSNGYLYLHYGDIHGSDRTFIDVETDGVDIPRIDIPLSEVSPASLLEHGDVVFVDASEDVDGTNKHVVIDNPRGQPFISGLHTIVAKRKTNEIDPRYMRYCFQTPKIKEQFRFYAVGTKVSGVSKTSIAKIVLPVPSPNDQCEIAATLDALEQEIELIVERLTKARQLKQAMMQQLLTGRIRLI